jgi:HEPN domain
MNPLTLEWAQKAEGDFEAAQCLSKSAAQLHDSICFHAQPCIEKNLKAGFKRPIPSFRARMMWSNFSI